MNDKKRVLIVSCSVGHGHYYTAEAIKNTFLLNYHHIEVEHIDFLNFIGIFSKKVYFDSFYPIARYLPKLCKFIYYNTDNVIGKKIFNLITNFSKKINTNRYFEYISNYQPDYVLCSHFIPADIIKNYSVKHKFNFRVGTLMTDYAIHELQKVSRDIDYYVVNDDINKELLSTGVSQKNIIVSGIPINPKFMEKINIDDILVKYRIDIVKKNNSHSS